MKPPTKQVVTWLKFVLITALICVAGAWGTTLLLPGADVARAVWTSAVVAVVVQAAAFAFTLYLKPANLFAGWGAGILLRVGSLTLYWLVAVRVMGLASGPALLSLAVFFFISTMVEPILLK